MASTIDKELQELLDKYEERQLGRRENRAQALSDEDKFIEEFNELRLAVIRPGMERVGRQIRLRDHQYTITEGDFIRERGSIAKPDEAWIKMTIFLAHEPERTRVGDVGRPHLAFTTDHRTKKVILELSDKTAVGGQTWKEGEYLPNQISALFIQEKFLALFARLARK